MLNSIPTTTMSFLAEYRIQYRRLGAIFFVHVVFISIYMNIYTAFDDIQCHDLSILSLRNKAVSKTESWFFIAQAMHSPFSRHAGTFDFGSWPQLIFGYYGDCVVLECASLF